MEILTYSLKNNNKTSDEYYSDISLFTDKVISESKSRIPLVVNEYIEYVNEFKLEVPRTKEEYLFDLINLGCLLQLYYPQYCNLKNYEYFILRQLYELRNKNSRLKRHIDAIRGILSTLFLTREKTGNSNRVIRLSNVEKLFKWMEASGEYREEVKRMILIYAFLSDNNESRISYLLNEITFFSGWFEREAANALGRYTPNVKNYLAEISKEHRWKEDVVFCGRGIVEYHLSMFGAEIMNRAFRARFLDTKDIAVLLPACMSLLRDGKCLAEKKDLDFICTGCSAGCNINKIRLDGIKKGYKVHIIPHSSEFSGWLKNWAAGKEIGVVGVACPLNLITGGLELKSFDIPSQCILLDYCGCKNHWHKKGIPTGINNKQLSKIIERVKKPNVKEHTPV